MVTNTAKNLTKKKNDFKDGTKYFKGKVFVIFQNVLKFSIIFFYSWNLSFGKIVFGKNVIRDNYHSGICLRGNHYRGFDHSGKCPFGNCNSWKR